jgi:hypothetical protein
MAELVGVNFVLQTRSVKASWKRASTSLWTFATLLIKTFAIWWHKRKTTVVASSVVEILYLSSRPSVNQSFSDVGVLVVTMHVLVVTMHHDSTGSLQCSEELA